VIPFRDALAGALLARGLLVARGTNLGYDPSPVAYLDFNLLALVGIGAGALLAALVGRVRSSLLYGVSVLDPVAYAVAATILLWWWRPWPASCRRSPPPASIPCARSGASERLG